MSVTLKDLRGWVEHVLSTMTMDTTLPGSTPAAVENNVINLAGRWFYDHHQWNFKQRPPISLDFVADQEYMELPSDFGQMIGYQMTNSLNWGITFTTPQAVANHRATTITVSQNYFWATFVQPVAVTPGQAMPPPRIEIWPTPGSAQSDIFTLWYYSKWVTLVNDDDVAQVPDYAEFPLAMACRAFAAGLSEQEVAGKDVHERLGPLMESTIFKSAYESDGLVQSDYGPMGGGAIQSTYPVFTWRSASASPVADPS